MARLNVPDRYVGGLAVILDLEDKHFKELLAALQLVQPTMDVQKLKSEMTSKLPDIEPMLEVLEALISLYGAQAGLDLSIGEFVEELCQAVEDKQDARLKITDENRSVFKDRLTKLLDITSISDLLKAADLQTEHNCVFHEARILSDIRPAFAPDIEDDLKGVVIIHNLKICYLEMNEFKEFYVAMDDDDIEKLSDILDRARKKTRKLKSLLKDANINCIEVK